MYFLAWCSEALMQCAVIVIWRFPSLYTWDLYLISPTPQQFLIKWRYHIVLITWMSFIKFREKAIQKYEIFHTSVAETIRENVFHLNYSIALRKRFERGFRQWHALMFVQPNYRRWKMHGEICPDLPPSHKVPHHSQQVWNCFIVYIICP